MPLTQQEIESQLKLKRNKPLVYEKIIKYDEKLARGESIANIQLQYNYICNMRCIHCSISDFQLTEKERILNIDDVKNIAKQADDMGLAQIVITGGEPTLFRDLEQLIQAINPEKFWIQCDTNGWLMNDKKAQYFKSLGIDKIQLSLDSMDAKEHDDFRQTPRSWERAVKSIDSMQKAGLSVIINTVVNHTRAQSQELEEFLKFTYEKGIFVNICWAKPTGLWAGHDDELVTEDDVKRVTELGKKYNAADHTAQKTFGRDIGCFAVKRMISITRYGDVMPCPWLYFSLGNIFETPLKEILDKGMKYFGKYESTCLAGNNAEFIKKYISQTYGKIVPIPIEEIKGLEEWIF